MLDAFGPVVLVVSFAIAAAVAWLVYRDAERRDMAAPLWALGTFLDRGAVVRM